MDVNEYSYPTILVSRLDDTQPDLRPKRQKAAAGYGSIDRTRRFLGGMIEATGRDTVSNRWDLRRERDRLVGSAGQSLRQQLHRIDRAAVRPDLVMDVIASGTPGCAHVPDHVATLHSVANRRSEFRKVAVSGR